MKVVQRALPIHTEPKSTVARSPASADRSEGSTKIQKTVLVGSLIFSVAFGSEAGPEGPGTSGPGRY